MAVIKANAYGHGDVQVARAAIEAGVSWLGVATSDEDETTTEEQLAQFLAIVADARSAGIHPAVLHAANSAAAILHPDSRLDLIRPGISVYGVQPAPGIGDELDLRPALTWRSAVSMVKRLRTGDHISYGHAYSLTSESWV